MHRFDWLRVLMWHLVVLLVLCYLAICCSIFQMPEIVLYEMLSLQCILVFMVSYVITRSLKVSSCFGLFAFVVIMGYFAIYPDSYSTYEGEGTADGIFNRIIGRWIDYLFATGAMLGASLLSVFICSKIWPTHEP